MIDVHAVLKPCLQVQICNSSIRWSKICQLLTQVKHFMDLSSTHSKIMALPTAFAILFLAGNQLDIQLQGRPHKAVFSLMFLCSLLHLEKP